jgi:hypothetical protein
VPINNQNVKQMITYLRTYWRSKLAKICVWEGNFPRTSNVAEGYHNGMKESFDKQVFKLIKKLFFLANLIQHSEKPVLFILRI